MPGLKFTATLSGFSEMQRKLKTAFDDGPSLLGEPWRNALDAIGKLGEQSAISAAPVESGATVAHMAYKVQRTPMPRYVVVKTTAKRGPFAYPRFTNFSPYASRIRPPTKAGAPRRARPNTRRYWFTNAIKRFKTQWTPILDRAKAQIEQRWGA